MNVRLQNIISKFLPPTATIFLLIAIWELACEYGNIPPYMLPSPVDVINALYTDRQLLLSHAGVTLTETFIGLFAGIIIGFVMAVIMDSFDIIRKMIYPLIVISQTIPTVAIAPLLVIWLGYQMLPKIVLIILVVFFPISIGLLEGFSSVDKDTVRLMRSMGAGNMQIFRFVKLPHSLGHFFSGLRISVSYAVVGAVVSEWIGGTQGLGCYMTRVRKSFSSDKLFGVIMLVSLLSLLLILLVDVLQRICMPWNKNKDKE